MAKSRGNGEKSKRCSVAIELYANGKLVASAIDKGLGGPPITSPGRVGIRADNVETKFKNFTVTSM